MQLRINKMNLLVPGIPAERATAASTLIEEAIARAEKARQKFGMHESADFACCRIAEETGELVQAATAMSKGRHEQRRARIQDEAADAIAMILRLIWEFPEGKTSTPDFAKGGVLPHFDIDVPMPECKPPKPDDSEFVECTGQRVTQEPDPFQQSMKEIASALTVRESDRREREQPNLSTEEDRARHVCEVLRRWKEDPDYYDNLVIRRDRVELYDREAEIETRRQALKGEMQYLAICPTVLIAVIKERGVPRSMRVHDVDNGNCWHGNVWQGIRKPSGKGVHDNGKPISIVKVLQTVIKNRLPIVNIRVHDKP